jgi:octaprenyl-diphosphate synthase
MFNDWEEHGTVENGLMAIVDRSPGSVIGELVSYVISSNGKRVRPMILMLCAQAFGAGRDKTLNAALAVELVHAASLVHDDILDCGVERRGAPSAVEEFGLEAALLTGDYLISKSIDLISDYDGPVIKAFARACMDMAEGEMLDLTRISSADEYYECVARKTASLFSASARIGCMIAQAPQDQVNRYADYGQHLGVAYQIMDDVEEAMGVDQGKRSVKRSMTLPMIHDRMPPSGMLSICMQPISEHVKAAVDAIAGAKGDAASKGRLLLIIDQMNKNWEKKCVLPKSQC